MIECPFVKSSLALQRRAEETSKKSCNDDMILFIFHINEDLTFCDFRKMAGRPFSGAVMCRYKTFFAAPSTLFGNSYATLGASLLFAARRRGLAGLMQVTPEALCNSVRFHRDRSICK
jgi:hypothetical protein